MSVGMTIDINSHGKTCDMAGMNLYMHCQGSDPASKPLRANAQVIYL
jgi:hypothetical protein